MRTLLLLNPNTSAEVSALLERHAAPVAQAAGLRLAVATARFGPRYITGEAGAAVGGRGAGGAPPPPPPPRCPQRSSSHSVVCRPSALLVVIVPIWK
jgi:hypothetical protein